MHQYILYLGAHHQPPAFFANGLASVKFDTGASDFILRKLLNTAANWLF